MARKRDLIDKETKENKDIDEDESLQYVVGRVRGQHCELKVEKYRVRQLSGSGTGTEADGSWRLPTRTERGPSVPLPFRHFTKHMVGCLYVPKDRPFVPQHLNCRYPQT